MILYSSLLPIPSMAISISVDEFLSFVRLAKLVHPAIELSGRDITTPPERLSTRIYEFLGAALGKSFTEVQWYWYGFKTAVWSGQVVAATPHKAVSCCIRVYQALVLQKTWNLSYY